MVIRHQIDKLIIARKLIMNNVDHINNFNWSEYHTQFWLIKKWRKSDTKIAIIRIQINWYSNPVHSTDRFSITRSSYHRWTQFYIFVNDILWQQKLDSNTSTHCGCHCLYDNISYNKLIMWIKIQPNLE